MADEDASPHRLGAGPATSAVTDFVLSTIADRIRWRCEPALFKISDAETARGLGTSALGVDFAVACRITGARFGRPGRQES